jgi:hypothetical protein
VGRHSIGQRCQIAVRRQRRPRQRGKHVFAMNQTRPVVVPLRCKHFSLLRRDLREALLLLLSQLLITLELGT